MNGEGCCASFDSLTAAMDGPRSKFFGIGPDGPRDPESYYAKLDTTDLTFDISNNQILCSLTAEGLAEHACVLKSVWGTAGVRGQG